MSTPNIEIPWGELRAAISSGDGAHLEAALESCHRITNEDRTVLQSYLEGKVRENPKLLDIWPVLFHSKYTLEDSFDLLSQPDTPLVVDTCSPCKGLPNSPPARLPLSYPFLYRAPLPMEGLGWDEVIWDEVMTGLDYVRAHVKHVLLSPYNRAGYPDNPLSEAINRMGFDFSQILFGLEASWYQHQMKIKACLERDEIPNPPSIQATRRYPFENCIRMLQHTPFSAGVQPVQQMWMLYDSVLNAGGTSLVALHLVYTQLQQIRLATSDMPNYNEYVTVLWNDALRRLMRKAWDLRSQS